MGTMVLKDPSSSNELDLGGPPVTLTFRNVPALTALQALARIGGYGFIANSKNSSLETTDTVRGNTAGGLVEKKTSTKETKVASPPVSASFVREDYGTAFNLILTSAGLQARLTPNGRTIIVGQNACGFGGGNIASKVYRLNQASPESAAHYLASLGSFIRIPRTFQTTQPVGTATNVGGGSTSGGETSSSSTSTITRGTEIQAFGGQVGPLQGLCGTIDKRLGTITLVGQTRLVSVGEQYLRQIDLRQRQVALSIRILDVSLGNDNRIENSFAFRYGNNFIVNDRGRLVGAFGNLLPPSADPANTAFNRGFPDFDLEFDPSTGRATATGLPTGYNALGGVGRVPPLTPSPDVAVFKDVTRRNPGVSYPRNNFFDFVTATIQSSNTKVLASPTIILSENSDEDDTAFTSSQAGSLSANLLGNISTNNFIPSVGRSRNNESAVVVGEQVVTSFSVQAGQNGAPNTCQPILGIAGLTFGAKVLKIDDNGFVTFKLSPAISAGIRRELVSGCGFIDILAIRSLDTGSSRVRDGQTLILTGVISDRDIQEVTKWPILGDMPFIGQFFRNTAGNRQKRELVVMVSPRIINDTEGGSYGYGFEPTSRDSRRFMNSSPSSAMPGFMSQP